MEFREIIPPNTQFDFIKYRNVCIIASLVCVLVGVVGYFWRGGFNLGIDFAGGSVVHARFQQRTTATDVRGVLEGDDPGSITIQDLGRETSEFLIRLPLAHEANAGADSAAKRVTDTLMTKFGADKVEILRVESVGPRVGNELRQKAILAVIFATALMGAYIGFRFEWRFGLGAAIALLHDVLLAMTALILWNYEFDLTIVAAMLTIVGFSVNDTVIVSDRIRENRRKDPRSPLATVMNRSINETLSRTILTTGTALLVVLTLYILGGSVIHGFAFTLVVGFIVGTYSSVYIASPVVLFFERPTGRRAPARR